MKKQVLFMVVLLAAVGLLAGVAASNAFAYAGGYGAPCGNCHGHSGAAPTVTLVSNNGTTATYNVTDATAHEWGVFSGNTRITGTGQNGNTETSGTFTVAGGSTYSIFAVYAEPGPDSSGGSTTVSPTGGATSFTVTPSAGANGSISPNTPQTVASGGSSTFTMTAAAGYHLADVLVNGTSVGAVSPYTVTNVTANTTIAASFAQDAATSFTITPTAGANGTITPGTATTVAAGTDQTFTMAPAAGYHVDTLTVDGTLVAPAKSYTFTNVTKDHTIAATFAATPTLCTITTTVVGSNGGTFVPMFPIFTLAATGSVTYYFVPDAGFHVDSVLVNGWPVTLDPDDSSYTFSNVDRNTTVSVKFLPNTWTLTASVSGKGSISPSGAKVVSEGSSATYTFTPDAGNALSDVLIDGKSVGMQSSYTFSNVTANHTIQAKFVAASTNFTITPSVVGGQGTTYPASAIAVPSSANLAVYFFPADGYTVDTVKVDGTAVDASKWNDDNAYSFENITASHTITVTFAKVVTYTLTPTAGEHGAITPGTAQTCNAGDNDTFTITPDAGYHVADVQVDGASVGAVTTYTFSNVSASHSISASFAWTKLATSTTLKASAKTVKRNGSVTLTARVTGGAFTASTIRYEVKKPGKHAYTLLKTVKLSSTGAATYKCKLTVKGSWYFRVKFLGNATYLPAPVKAALKVAVK